MVLAHFCCCLPLRLGTILITFIVALYGITVAVISIVKSNDISNSLGSPAGLWTEVVLHLLIGLTGIAGLFGVFRANAALLKTFSIIYWCQIIFTTVLETILLIVAGVHKPAAVTLCEQEWYQHGGLNGPDAMTAPPAINSTTPVDPNVVSTCNSAINGGIGGLAAFIVLYTMFQIYCAYIVVAYTAKVKGKQRYSMLKDQQLRDWDQRIMPMKQPSMKQQPSLLSQGSRY